MTNKTLGLASIALGILMLAVSLSADQLGLGTVVGVIGWKQWIGAAVGFLLFLAGLWLSRKVTPSN
jgi:hypothetical protein